MVQLPQLEESLGGSMVAFTTPGPPRVPPTTGLAATQHTADLTVTSQRLFAGEKLMQYIGRGCDPSLDPKGGRTQGGRSEDKYVTW